MRVNLFFLFFFFVGFVNAQQKAEINLVSFNIRYSTESDGENAWSKRKENVKDLVKFYDVDILCAQEVLAQQYDYILANSNFAAEGAGRDDGLRKGEFSPIFYDKIRFVRKDGGMFWLSETPNVPSKGWDAVLNRVCTWVRLYDKQSKKEFLVFNTHYDHKGVQARIESAKLVRQKIQEIAPKLPVVFTGDLNVTPETEAIATIKSFLKDSKEISVEPPYGPEGTFNGFKFDSALKDRIDYVFVNPKVVVRKYGVLTDSKHMRYFSDHLPVFVKISF